MPKKNQRIIIVSFIIALLLDTLPMPGFAIWFRPQWTLLILIYWLIETPYTIGFFAVFCLGLILDVLNGALLGMHAIGFLIIAYLIYKTYHLIRSYHMTQQAIVVFLIIVLYQLISLIILMIINAAPHTGLYFGSSLTTAILWPWIFWVMREWRNLK
jgi:rod shape-determining protein MreD